MERFYPRWNARIWESGEFSLGYLPAKRVNKVELPPEFGVDEQNLINTCGCIRAHGYEKTKEFIKEHPELYPHITLAPSPLESTPVPKSHSEAKRGQKGISGHGKKLVRNAALRLERECGIKHLSFLTLTVPGVTPEGALVLVENWAEIVRIFQQRLKRRLIAKGLSGEMVGVTEVQEKRMASSGVVALHLHIVFQGRRRYQSWALRPGDVRSMWRDTLSPYLTPVEGGFYWDAVENLVHIHSSAVGYLGKYMSKGSKVCDEIIKNHPGIVLPTCWYLCTNTLRKRVFQNIRFITSNDSPWFESMCSSMNTQDVFTFIRPVFIAMKDGVEYQVGWVGKFQPDAFRAIAEAIPHRDNKFAVAEYL